MPVLVVESLDQVRYDSLWSSLDLPFGALCELLTSLQLELSGGTDGMAKAAL